MERKKIARVFSKKIVDQTDGVPLFIEDLVFSLLQSTHDYSNDYGFEKISVPDKLSEHLMSRIDKMGDMKRIMQIGAVEGREFSITLISALTNIPITDLQRGMDKLMEAGLVIVNAKPNESRFLFRHAMIRDAAYESLLIADRMELHSRMASWYETEDLIFRQTHPEIIAHHYVYAGAFELAVKYWLQAGLQSNSRANYAEAFIHLENARNLIPKLTQSSIRDRIELDTIIALGVANAGTRGISGADTGKTYERALFLCKALDYPSETFPVLAGAGSLQFIRSNYQHSLELALLSLQLGKDKSNETGLVIGNRIMGAVQCMRGEFNSSIDSLQNAIRIYDENPKVHRSYSLAYALDHKTTAMCYLALANLVIGKIDIALEFSQQAVTHSSNIDPHSLNCALSYQTAVHHLREDSPQLILNVASRSLTLATEEGYASWLGMSRLLQGEAYIRLTRLDEGMMMIENGVDEHSNVMALTFLPLAQSVLAKGYLATEQYENSLSILLEAESLSIKTNQHWYLPEVQRLHAETLICQKQYEDAYAVYNKAWLSASEIGAKFWQLKIACSMANNKIFAMLYDDVQKRLKDSIAFFDEDNKESYILAAIKLLENSQSGENIGQ